MTRLGFCVVAALCFLAAGASSAATIVVPNGQAAAEGCANNLYPWSSGNFGVPAPAHYQQVYAASQFAAGGSALLITAISFRADDTAGGSAGQATGLVVKLSTTSNAVDGLSTTFASNLGADVATVYSGTFNVTYGAGSSGPRPFDLTVPLTTPFTYHPANGNLLLDISITSATGFFALDAQSESSINVNCPPGPDGVSRLRSTTADTTVGSADTIGLVTQFTYGAAPVELQSFGVE